MFTIYLYQYGPAAVGLLVALGVAFVRRRLRVPLPKGARLATAIGVTIALGCLIAFSTWSAFSTWVPSFGEDTFLVLMRAGYLAPLVLSAVALLFLVVPVPTSGPPGSAALAPRTVLTFASRRWLAATAGAVVAIVAIALLAGLGSSPDQAGRYVLYEVRPSSNTSASTTIYGWWFSLPSLIAVAIVVAIALLGMVVISRPALAADAQHDTAIRKARVRNILAVSTGGILLHLGTVLRSLYGASTLRAGFPAGQAGWVELGTSFAAIGPALLVTSFVTGILGIAMWWYVLLSVLPVRTRQPSEPAVT
ncbi:hypothetical protein [Microbacterium sp. 18062]|uniref:hypothetical protein n=1 Tax=Microbacterium sp. 18062 TaxID=2681410 RepID=UPI00135A0E88|nr:hypothetical protein [Microbacterium sp. 18062]